MKKFISNNFHVRLGSLILTLSIVGLTACGQAELGETSVTMGNHSGAPAPVPAPADTTGPQVVSRSPDGALSLSFGEKSESRVLEITFDETLVLKDIQAISVSSGIEAPSGGPVSPRLNLNAIYSTVMEPVPVTATIDPNNPRVLRLAATFQTGQNYQVNLGEACVEDEKGNATAGYNWNFSVHAGELPTDHVMID